MEVVFGNDASLAPTTAANKNQSMDMVAGDSGDGIGTSDWHRFYQTPLRSSDSHPPSVTWSHSWKQGLTPLAAGKLPTVLVDGHGGGSHDVVTGGLSVDRYFYYVMQAVEYLLREPLTLGANDQRRAMSKSIVIK